MNFLVEKMMPELSNLGPLKSFKRVDLDSTEKEDKNRQGSIRIVKNAHLVYKRKNEIEKYNELWIYKSKKNGIFQDIDIKLDITSGTDIPVNKTESEDGSQYYEIWHCGNIVFLKIFNLVN